ncbi:MAG: efflux RND transporter periplasmic adaptor subunit [Clostridia bacterium]|nr:efflux RND transporter periplasmic adaptor subunit [Clostridia bacterium]
MSTFNGTKILKNFSLLLQTSIIIIFLLTGCGKSELLVLSGTVESTQIEVNSEASGKIICIEKKESTLINKNDEIAVIDASVQELVVKQQESIVKLKEARLDELKSGSRAEQLQQAEAAVKSAKAKLDELKAGSRPEQIRQAEASVNTAKASVETAQISYDYWLDKYKKIKELYNSDKVSESELSDAKYKLDTAGQQLKTSNEQLNSAQSQLDLLKNGASEQAIQAAQANYEQTVAQLDLLKNGSTSQAIKAAEADLEQSKASLEQAKLLLSKYHVKSPVDGTLILNNVNIGDMVNVGTSVGTVSDLNDLWVKVYIPQKNLNAVKLGQELELKSPLVEGNIIKGKVIYIASESEFTPKNTETKDAKENTVFKVKVKIMDNVDKLRPGSTIDAYIPLS